MENPPSSSGTLSSIKNLDDAFTFGDQFLNEKSLEDEPGKTNVETESESIVTVPIHQASSSAPPLSTPIIDLSPPKPSSPSVQEPIFTETTTTTTTLLLPPPTPQQQSTTNLWLAALSLPTPPSKRLPQSEQPVNDVPIPDDVHISDSEDTSAAHLPKIKTRPDWLKHVP
ncbi:hypothetical protein Tco_1175701 [Tanacetum coccineum]